MKSGVPLILCLAISFTTYSRALAARIPACHGSPTVEVARAHRDTSYRFERKTYKTFPMDAVSAYTLRCPQDSQLTVVSTSDVPFPVLLEAANQRTGLQLSGARIFLKTRGRYKEIMVDAPVSMPSISPAPLVTVR